MRWKLLLRRLSVSAPHMRVRSSLPWPLRWLVLALMLGFSAALAVWAFETGRSIAGLDRSTRVELERLRGEVEVLRVQQQQAVQVANAAESLVTAERAAVESLMQQLRQLEADKQALRDDLGFFEQLMPLAGDGVQLRGLRADSPGLGQLRYQMLVMLSGKGAAEFDGGYEVLLLGERAGEPWSQALPEGVRPLQLRQYARVEGMIDHPVEAVIQSVQVRVLDTRGAPLATQTLRMP
jgi:hypothetical protein